MNKLMLTTAILLTTSGAILAQESTITTTPSDASSAEQTINNEVSPETVYVPAFRASDFSKKNLYVLNPEVVTEIRGNSEYDERTARWASGETFIARRDQWEDIGSINDLIMAQDGQLQGVLLDIGGFLGIGTHSVLVGINDLYFVPDSSTPEDLGDFFIVASMSRDQLEALPEWDDSNLVKGYPASEQFSSSASDAQIADAANTAPAAMPMDHMTPTAEELTGADVEDAEGNSIGKIGDLELDGNEVTGARVDVGGFLGIGTHNVMVPIGDLMITRDEDGKVDHIQTLLTRDQLEGLPTQD